MKKLKKMFLSALLLTPLTLLGAQTSFASHGNDLDCDHFSSHEEAQAHFDAHEGDPDRLDRDGDGLACESNEGTGSSNDSSTESESNDEAVTENETTEDSESEQGGQMPDTASPLPLGILGGLGAMALGALGIRKRH